ncbi:efflux RND transporter periplasmic adaptor subunit [Sulfurimonas sp. MAG313]|nr:efflux RND transporter periplasmic adaptor subunit [Sulfurimonas sp. MAG313]MDF1882087.1 efflux RND transporter periplasmic adaptor subunit [Sulfurimonas sp. MAG313]
MVKHLLILLFSLPLLALVVTEPIIKGELSQIQKFNGTLSFNQKSKLASESTGLITKLYFEEGDYVKKGTVLLEIDTQILDATIKSIQASMKEVFYSLQRARLDFNRYETLLAKESVSKQKYDEFYFQKMQLEQKYLSLESSLQAQNIAKNKKSVKAPFDGYISSRKVQVGEWLKQGSEVALLVNPKKLDILIHLPSSYIQNIGSNKTVLVKINGKTYKSKLLATLLSGNERTRTFPIKLRLFPSNDKFFDGMQASVSLQKSLIKDVLLVSRDGIIKRFGKDVVFLVKDKKAVMVPVTVIGFEGQKVALSSANLKVGDKVVIKGNERIFPNQEIK